MSAGGSEVMEAEPDSSDLRNAAPDKFPPPPSLPTSAAGLSLCLAVAGLAMLAIMLPLDGNVREEYPTGTAMPLPMLLLLWATATLATMTWLAAAVLGGLAFLKRRPHPGWAAAALIVNVFSAALFVLTR